jgi:hypothetical protein
MRQSGLGEIGKQKDVRLCKTGETEAVYQLNHSTYLFTLLPGTHLFSL